MVEGVGVSDEQLDEMWLRAIEGSDHMRMAGRFGHDPDGWFRGTVRELVGEVRASHAREAEQRAATILANKVWAEAAAERDVLQERIDKALETIADWEHVNDPDNFWARSVRAAVTGAGDQPIEETP